MYPIYQINLKPHKQQLEKNLAEKWCGSTELPKLLVGKWESSDWSIKDYTYNSTFSNGCRSRNEKVSAKAESDLKVIKVAEKTPIGFSQHWLYPGHTTQFPCAFQIIRVSAPSWADPKIARCDLLPARVLCTVPSTTLLMAQKGLCRMRANLTTHCRVPHNLCLLQRSTGSWTIYLTVFSKFYRLVSSSSAHHAQVLFHNCMFKARKPQRSHAFITNSQVVH